ncbi:hypothetical protein [Clostridium akagii]|uniref:hypothetical protein n=1 Tax=Clostridium akagii TaxID=91623 RepID=UPI00047DFCD1|nr:hypothetical protein [Clostridium akagii]
MNDVTYGAKVDNELKSKLDSLQKNSGARTGKEFMQLLVSSYELESTKENIPEIAEDLKELQSLTQRIDNIYLNLGKRIENIAKAQEGQQQIELDKKNSIILELRGKIDTIVADKDKINESYNNIVNENNEHLQRVKELTESNDNIKTLIEEYKSKNDTLAGLLNEYKEYKTDNEKIKELLTDAQKKLTDKDTIIKDRDYNLNILTKEIKSKEDNISTLEMKYKEELKYVASNHLIDMAQVKKENEIIINNLNGNIQNLKVEHEQELQTSKKLSKIDKDMAVLDKDKEHQKIIEELNSKYNKEIEDYQAKYKNILGELEQLKVLPKTKTKDTK